MQSSGFIPPGKTYGQMEVYNIENGQGPWDIASNSHERKDWAYHWAVWKDIDADGLMDCVTARYTLKSMDTYIFVTYFNLTLLL